MTDQMFVFLCRDVRKYVFDYRRGELEDAERRKFDEHVAACETCRDYVNRIEGMLDAAAIHDFAGDLDRDAMFDRIVAEGQAAASRPESSDPTGDESEFDESEASDREVNLDRDSLFDRISSKIEPSRQDEDGIVRLERMVQSAGENDESGQESEARAAPHRSRRVMLYVAAALAAGIVIGLFLPRLGEQPATPTDANLVASGADDSVENQSPLPGDEPAAIELADLSVQPTPADVEDVRVFGAPTANWSLRTQGVRRQIDLDAGTVLVEFVPEANRELEVVTEHFTVRVTGTIFYASAEEDVVGVVTGSVEVETPDGEQVKLVDGQEWVRGHGLRQAPKQTLTQAELHVDKREHARALERAIARRVATTGAAPSERAGGRQKTEPPPLSPEVAKTPTDELRRSAKQALQDGRYDVAAQYYERMVDEFPPGDPANASLRLDLSRIYIRHLDRPERAMTHLRRFVEDRPDDPAAPSARTELCRIIGETGRIDPLCDF